MQISKIALQSTQRENVKAAFWRKICLAKPNLTYPLHERKSHVWCEVIVIQSQHTSGMSLANSAVYGSPTFFTMLSKRYKAGSFEGGAHCNPNEDESPVSTSNRSNTDNRAISMQMFEISQSVRLDLEIILDPTACILNHRMRKTSSFPHHFVFMQNKRTMIANLSWRVKYGKSAMHTKSDTTLLIKPYTSLTCWICRLTASAIPCAATLFSLASIVNVLMIGFELNVRSRSSRTYWSTNAALFEAITSLHRGLTLQGVISQRM